jgi:putrescine transport system substrate-binding protein
MIRRTFLAATAFLALGATGKAEDRSKVLNLYSWADYFPETVIKKFEAETGIKVNYTVFDSNDVVETKLSSGKSGFDLVTPNASPHLGRQIPKGLWAKLDKSKIPNLKNIDAGIMKTMESVDPGNQYAIPWMWGTTGIIYNADKVKEIMPDAPVDSMAMVFDPAVVSKFKDCGVNILDSWGDLFPMATRYLGQKELSAEKADLDKVLELFANVRPSIKRVNSSGYFEQLARGEICLAIGYSGDAMIARRMVDEAKGSVKIEYRQPKEAVPLYIDSLAIPADAENPDAAYKFINFLLQPEIAAETTNYIGFANANSASTSFLDPAVRDNPAIYPPEEVRARFYMERVYSAADTRTFSRAWLRVKSGR